jgi:hypothetical protein
VAIKLVSPGRMRSRMAHPLALAAGHVLPAPKIDVVVLHPEGAGEETSALARTWQPAVPAATMTAVNLTAANPVALAALLNNRLGTPGPDAPPRVIAAVLGAEGSLLHLLSEHMLPECTGLLVCGETQLQVQSLRRISTGGRISLRLAWEADDPLPCAVALGEMLRRYRAAGYDAEGAVLSRPALSAQAAHARPSASLVRLGGAYLAELVAVALTAMSRSA